LVESTVPDVDLPLVDDDLLGTVVEPKTSANYATSIAEFATFLIDNGWDSIDTIAKHPERLNKGKGPSAGSTLLAALQNRYPRVRKNLPEAWRAWSSWRDKVPVVHRKAWPVLLLAAMSGLAFYMKEEACAFAYLVGFHCLFRPGELGGFQVSDIFFQDGMDALIAALCILTIRFPKTRKRGARLQYGAIENPLLLDWFKDYIARQPNLDAFPVFHSYRILREKTLLLLEALLGPKSGFSLHGIRGGGATQHYLRFKDVPRLCRLGRWASDKSLTTYIQLQTAMLGAHHWDNPTMARLTHYAQKIPAELLLHA
jgi:integrase